jgi:CheY-like chemotaxis protein
MQSFQAPPSSQAPTRRERVLVVDDSGMCRRVISASLTSTFDVVEAAHGLEAIDLLRSTSDFACVVTDDQMPGCSGLGVVEFVRGTPGLSHIPVVVVSGGSDDSIARQVAGHRAGASVFINKPIMPAKLLKMVTLLARTRKGAAA